MLCKTNDLVNLYWDNKYSDADDLEIIAWNIEFIMNICPGHSQPLAWFDIFSDQ